MSGHADRYSQTDREKDTMTPAKQALHMSGHAETIRTIRFRADLVRRAGFEFYQAPKVAQDALAGLAGEMDKWADALDALLAENQRLADRAVCSGCGGDVDEGGACHYTGCDGGEMIPASDLPGALLALNDASQEEREEWRFDWEALRSEAKGLEAENQRLREALATVQGDVYLWRLQEIDTDKAMDAIDKSVSVLDSYREALAGEDG